MYKNNNHTIGIEVLRHKSSYQQSLTHTNTHTRLDYPETYIDIILRRIMHLL